MKVLKVQTKPYNHHDPNTKMVLSAASTNGLVIFKHLVGSANIDDTPSNRDNIQFLAGFHGVKVTYAS